MLEGVASRNNTCTYTQLHLIQKSVPNNYISENPLQLKGLNPSEVCFETLTLYQMTIFLDHFILKAYADNKIHLIYSRKFFLGCISVCFETLIFLTFSHFQNLLWSHSIFIREKKRTLCHQKCDESIFFDITENIEEKGEKNPLISSIFLSPTKCIQGC